MKAYKCDICDKLYVNPREYAERTDPITDVTVGFIPTTLAFGDETFSTRTLHHDICPDCIQFFHKVIPVIRQKGGTDWMVWPQ